MIIHSYGYLESRGVRIDDPPLGVVGFLGWVCFAPGIGVWSDHAIVLLWCLLRFTDRDRWASDQVCDGCALAMG